MDVGIFTWTNAAIDPAVVAKRAEELGFESFWVPELPIIPVEADQDFPTDTISGVDTSSATDPFVALSRASAATTWISSRAADSSSASAPADCGSSRRSWGPTSTTAGPRPETRCWR